MKLYLLLSSGGKVSPDPNERAAVMKELSAWYGKLGSTLIDGGAAFSGKSKTIASDGKVSDGVEVTAANGYMVIKTDSLEAAVSIASGYPLLKSGFKLSVFETFKDVA